MYERYKEEQIMLRNPGIAAVLSFFWTGVGQIYNGQLVKGIILILVQMINAALMFVLIGFITYPIVWIWGMYDAYKTAERMNR
jgi:TM2 domain-containing membrane protein YozV